MRRPMAVLAGAAALMAAMGSASAQPGSAVSPAEPELAPVVHRVTSEPGPVRGLAPTDDVIPPVAQRIFELGTGHGFVSLRTDYDAGAITVLWQGEEVPADVRAYADSTPLGVSVTLTTGARYSREEGNAARAGILEDPIVEEIGIVSASVNHDGSGLTLGITHDGVTDEQRARLARLSGLAADEITINGGRAASAGYPVILDNANS